MDNNQHTNTESTSEKSRDNGVAESKRAIANQQFAVIDGHLRNANRCASEVESRLYQDSQRAKELANRAKETQRQLFNDARQAEGNQQSIESHNPKIEREKDADIELG